MKKQEQVSSSAATPASSQQMQERIAQLEETVKKQSEIIRSQSSLLEKIDKILKDGAFILTREQMRQLTTAADNRNALIREHTAWTREQMRQLTTAVDNRNARIAALESRLESIAQRGEPSSAAARILESRSTSSSHAPNTNSTQLG